MMIHTYDPDDEGRCKATYFGNSGREIVCHSTQRSSVLHDDPMSTFRERHWHSGGDCMCFESDEDGSQRQAELESLGYEYTATHDSTYTDDPR